MYHLDHGLRIVEQSVSGSGNGCHGCRGPTLLHAIYDPVVETADTFSVGIVAGNVGDGGLLYLGKLTLSARSDADRLQHLDDALDHEHEMVRRVNNRHGLVGPVARCQLHVGGIDVEGGT